jgi:hypothetical protein
MVESLLAYLKIISYQFPGGTEANHKTLMLISYRLLYYRRRISYFILWNFFYKVFLQF